MSKSILDTVVGSLDEKRAYRRLVARVNALPPDYRFAFKALRNYMYNTDLTGCGMELFTDLAELLEAGAAEGKQVLEVLGDDAAAFCDGLVRARCGGADATREALNREIMDHFHREAE